MAFTLPDLVIEGALRKGFDFLRLNPGADAIPFSVGTLNSFTADGRDTLRLPSGTLNFSDVNMTVVVSNHTIRSITSDEVIIDETNGPGIAKYSTGDTFQSQSTISGSAEQSVSGSINRVVSASQDTTGSVLLVFNVSITALSGSSLTNWSLPFIIGGSDEGSGGLQLTGEIGRDEVFGAGGFLLNMLFNFKNVPSSDMAGGGIGTTASKYIMEPERLRKFFRKNEIAIVQGYADEQAHLPCISILLDHDGEDEDIANVDDFGGTEGVFDSDVSARDRLGRDLNLIHAKTVVNIGIHSKEQLLTKYLFTIAKYFILSAKQDLIRQNLINLSFKASGFSQDKAWKGDHVYTRYLNISGKTEDSWVNLNEIVTPLEEISVQAFVGRDVQAFEQISSRLANNVAAGAEVLLLSSTQNFPDAGTGRLFLKNGLDETIGNVQIVSWDANDKGRGELTLTAGLTTGLIRVFSSDPSIERLGILFDGTQNIQASTVQTRPSTIALSQRRQNIDDQDDILHRNILSGATKTYTNAGDPNNNEPSPVD